MPAFMINATFIIYESVLQYYLNDPTLQIFDFRCIWVGKNFSTTFLRNTEPIKYYVVILSVAFINRVVVVVFTLASESDLTFTRIIFVCRLCDLENTCCKTNAELVRQQGSSQTV